MEEEQKRETYGSLVSLADLAKAADNPERRELIINGTRVNADGEPVKPTEDEKGAAKVIEILLLISWLIAFIVLLGFSQLDKLLGFAAFGYIMLSAGSLVIVKTGLSEPMLLILPYVGALMTGIPISLIYERKHPGALPFTFDKPTILSLIFYSMAGIGALLIISQFSKTVRLRRRCTERVSAKCIYLNYTIEHSGSGLTRRAYKRTSPVWQYEYGGDIYVTSEYSYGGNEAGLGSICDLYVSESAPTLIYRPSKTKLMIVTVVGILWIALSLYALTVIK